MKTIGPRILELRKRRGLTQEQLSDLSNINLRTLQRIEKGTSEPRSNTLKSLCQVLEVNMETLHLEAKTPNLKLIKYMHLSVLTCIFFPLGCIFFPAIIWFTNRNKVLHVNEQGINIINYQILWSILLYSTLVLWSIFTFLHWCSPFFIFYPMSVFYLANLIYPIIIYFKIKQEILKPFYFNTYQFIKM